MDEAGAFGEQPTEGEKVCPQCAETVKAAALVCRFCGHRFDGSIASEAAASAAVVPTAQSASPSSGIGARGGILIWGVASAFFMLIGSFGPWVKALGASVSGTDGGNDGWLVVTAAVILGVLMFVARNNRGAGLLALIGGIIGATITIHDRGNVTNAINQHGALAAALVHVGWGLNLAMIASISFAIAGVVWLLAVPSESSVGTSAGNESN